VKGFGLSIKPTMPVIGMSSPEILQHHLKSLPPFGPFRFNSGHRQIKMNRPPKFPPCLSRLGGFSSDCGLEKQFGSMNINMRSVRF
jgi:hypothetical protein